jgi:hypothetical protein
LKEEGHHRPFWRQPINTEENKMPYDVRNNTFTGAMRDILETFASLNEQYEKECEDAAHWYTENTSTALLSVAAWQCGYPALCETQSSKRVYGRRGRPPSSNGRVDLFLYDADGTGLWVEAKKPQGSMDVSEDSDYQATTARLSRFFWDAYSSAKQNRVEAQEYEGKLVSLLFCSFSLRKEYYEGQNASERRRAQADTVNAVIKEVVNKDGGASVFASYFNTGDTDLIDEYDNRAFGFAVLGHFEDA